MAMNLGFNTTKIFIGQSLRITNDQWDDGFSLSGIWTGGNIYDGSTATALNENHYIDIGIVTDEREEVAVGGIPISIPGTSASTRLFWAVGGKSIRVTVSGIIPDGYYINADPTYLPTRYGNNVDIFMSNVSIFRYKLNLLLAYQSLGNSVVPHVIQYRRRYLIEDAYDMGNVPSQDTPSEHGNTFLAKWVITGYSIGFIEGTRNLRYTLTLDLANNDVLGGITGGVTSDRLKDGIYPRGFGDIR